MSAIYVFVCLHTKRFVPFARHRESNILGHHQAMNMHAQYTNCQLQYVLYFCEVGVKCNLNLN
jgi:hypothetical protein